MIIGVDFDNTIVCYDEVFHRVASEKGLIPDGLPARKNAVRDYLRDQGQEREWTELQGSVYGARMAEAQPFPGVRDFFVRGREQGIPLYIISHKTPKAVVGPAYDLHQAARDWLDSQGFFDRTGLGLPPEHVYFGVTRQEKVGLIRQTGCTHFVDDLEETFLEESFPANVSKILFGRSEALQQLPDARPARDWRRVTEYVFGADQ